MIRRQAAIAGVLVVLAWMGFCWPLATGGEPSLPVATAADGAASPAATPAVAPPGVVRPLVILGIGMVIVLGLIIVVKINPFITMVVAAMVVSVLAVVLLGEGQWSDSIARVAMSFGSAAGKIGIVIGMAAVIGKCMLDSGAADRIVRTFLRLFGEKRSPLALTASGWVLAVPVFFDTVFYLLVPLARSLYRRTRRNYLLYILAIGGGGAITHTLVPPTPGPLVIAATLEVDVGFMILIGGLVALPSAAAGLTFAYFANRWMPIAMRPIGDQPDPEPLDDSQLPPLWLSILPVVLPVVLISMNTIVEASAKSLMQPQLQQAGLPRSQQEEQLTRWLRSPDEVTSPAARRLAQASGLTNMVGNANFALLLSCLLAVAMLVKQRQLALPEMAKAVETALMSGGVIILITAAGGAFGEMLKVARVGEAIQQLFAGAGGSGGLLLLVLGFSISAVLKTAQGSSTVAMITGSAMLAGIASPESLGFHPVYLATAIGGGSLVASWMNDSGFWIVAKMSGLTEIEALKSWTLMLVVLGTFSLAVTMLLAVLMPMV